MMGVKPGLSQSIYAPTSTLPGDSSSITGSQQNRLDRNSLNHVCSNQNSETSSQSSSDISITIALNSRPKSYPKEIDQINPGLWQCRSGFQATQNLVASNNIQKTKWDISLPEMPKSCGNNWSQVNLGFKSTRTTEIGSPPIPDSFDLKNPKNPARITIKSSCSSNLAFQEIGIAKSENYCQKASTLSELPLNNDESTSNAICQGKSEFSNLDEVKDDSVRSLKAENVNKDQLSFQIEVNPIPPSLNPNLATSQCKYFLDHDIKVPCGKLDTSYQVQSPEIAETYVSSKISLSINTGYGMYHDLSIKNGDHISVSSKIQNLDNFEDTAYIDDKKKEKVRALQGIDPILEHIDFSGSRIPPPCDWEGGRPKFDNSFMNSYILEWLDDIADSSLQDTGFQKKKEWLLKSFHVDGLTLLPPFEHQEIYPTPGETCELEAKRKYQTVFGVIRSEYNKFQQKLAKQRRFEKKYHNLALETVYSTPEANSFSPKIPMYLRPAEIKDSEQIARIYNKHVAEGNITEDQELISTADALHLINKNRKERLPFIVAVAGKTPYIPDVQRYHAQQQSRISRFEKIIGFAFNERYNYGFSGGVKGRSRYTTTLQLFVAHDYQRKGVGRNLLDRLIHTLSTAYGYKKACDFINPQGDKVHECEGSGLWHQIQFHVPVLKSDDPDFPGINNFLYSQFLVKELYRMKSTGRTNVSRGPAKWLDTAIFQFETSQEGNFDPYC